MKRSFKWSAILVVFCVVFSGSLVGQSSAVSRLKSKENKRSGKTDTSKNKVTIERIERDVSEALTIIQDNHTSGDDLNYNELFKITIETMLGTLDPHSGYYDAKQFEAFLTDQNSRYFGIGATINSIIKKDGKPDGTYIKATFNGAPANRAGLRYGDKILEVNGVSVDGKFYPYVRDRLRGPRGTPAKIVIERYGTKKREKIEIIRDAVSTPSITEAYMIEPGVGYIAMSGGFTRTTYREFRVAMQKFKSQGMKNLVIDLRNNGGGLVNQALYIANTFLKEGQTILTQKGRIRGASRTFRADNPTPDDTPLVVLLNQNSASASEILAGALQDHDRALLVGENSFGKGIVTNPFQIEYGSMLLLAIAKYATPSGRSIQRDYSDGNLYDYKRGRTRDKAPPKSDEKRTDSGRVVYGGNGITPDVIVKTPTVSVARRGYQSRLVSPIFEFVLDLTFGKLKGYDGYRIDQPIAFNRNITNADFPITPELFAAFKNFAAKKYGLKAEHIDKERDFVRRIMRTEIVTAAYGVRTSYQVYNEYDPQLQRALKLFPEAKQLAIRGSRAYSATK